MIDKNNENENLLQQDLLDRKKYSDFLTEYIVKQDEPFVININSPWGTGKTFFLKQWMKDIEVHPAVYFNAWEHDYYKDPISSIVTCIHKELNQLYENNSINLPSGTVKKTSSFLKAVAPTVVKGAISKMIGQDATNDLFEMSMSDEKIATGLSGDIAKYIIAAEDKEKQSIKEYGIAIAESIEQLHNNESCDLKAPLFIFIDELDRCRPTFSIELLESIKHLFGIKGVVFIIATDTKQLSHSVKAIYGEGFNGELYLRRFFDQIYTLPEPNYFDYSMMLLEGFGSEGKLFNGYCISRFIKNRSASDIPDKFTINTNSSKLNYPMNNTIYPKKVQLGLVFALFSGFFTLDLRTLAQCFNKFHIIVDTAHENNEVHYTYLIFLIMLEAKAPNEFSNFFKETDLQKRLSVIKSINDTQYHVLTLRNKKITAIKYIEIYINILNMNEHDIQRKISNVIEQTSIESSYEWLNSVENNYQDLNNYKNKVLMASHFTD